MRKASIARGLSLAVRRSSLLREMDEQRTALLGADSLADMAFAGGVLDEHDAAWPEDPCLAIAGGDLNATAQVDDELAAWRRVVVQVVVQPVPAEVQARHSQRLRQEGGHAVIGQRHLDVLEVGYTVRVLIQ